MKAVIGDPESPLSRAIAADQADREEQAQVDDIDNTLAMLTKRR